MKGQGIVEYVVIIVLMVVVVIVIVALLGPTIGNLMQGADKSPCSWNSGSIACKNARVDQCMALEKYTLDQCVRLVGSGK